MREIVGDEVAYTLESMTRAVYTLGEKISRDQGIIIADTKFEFGRDADGRIILIDEVMTPDSSRFWAADAYSPASHNRVSTSSRCAIISTPSGAPAAGTAKPRRRACRRAWWSHQPALSRGLSPRHRR
jgi:phosphoribosylaminoimidazole-succinocarboxamide synthase